MIGRGKSEREEEKRKGGYVLIGRVETEGKKGIGRRKIRGKGWNEKVVDI